MFSEHFKLIESIPQLNLVSSFITLVPQTSVYSINIQDNANVVQKDVKMYCDTNQFPALPFYGPHPKPCGETGLSKQYNLRFDPKLGHGICATLRIPCSCIVCTSMIDQPFMYGTPLKKHAINLSQIVLTG